MSKRLAIAILLSAVAPVSCTRPEPPPAREPAYEGYHDIVNCNGLMAWAWDRNRPDEPVLIDVYDGDMRIATATAGDLRQDLLRAGKGNGRHGLHLPTPMVFKDGRPHQVWMKYAGTSVALANGPRELICPPAG
jgi:hypothetical protein